MLFFCREAFFFPQIDVCCLLYMAYIYNNFKALWFSLDTAIITTFFYTSLSLCSHALLNTE